MPLYKIRAEAVISTENKDEAIKLGEQRIGQGRWSSLEAKELENEQM